MSRPRKPSKIEALEKRIRELEDEVKRLRQQPLQIHHHHHHPQPMPYFQPPQSPYPGHMPIITCGGSYAGDAPGTYGGRCDATGAPCH